MFLCIPISISLTIICKILYFDLIRITQIINKLSVKNTEYIIISKRQFVDEQYSNLQKICFFQRSMIVKMFNAK